MAKLFPTFEVPTIVEEAEKNEAIYKTSSYFDFEKGDFILDGAGRMVEASGYDTWVQWCIKTIATERQAYENYTAGLGIQGEAALAQKTAALQQLALETTITEALLADPYKRTVEVRDFVWTRKTDSIHMECTIVGQDDRTAGIEYDIPTEGRSA